MQAENPLNSRSNHKQDRANILVSISNLGFCGSPIQLQGFQQFEVPSEVLGAFRPTEMLPSIQR